MTKKIYMDGLFQQSVYRRLYHGWVVCLGAFGIVLIVWIGTELYLRIQAKTAQEHQLVREGLADIYGSLNRALEIRSDYANYRLIYDPNVRWRGQPNQHTGVISTNSEGLRTKEIHSKKDIHTKRVILLGGSGAWGSGVTSNDATLASRLEHELQNMATDKQKDLTIEVIPLADIGYTSDQEYALWKRVVALDADAVVHLTGYNDAYEAWTGRQITIRHRSIPEYLLLGDKKQMVLGIFHWMIDDVLSRSLAYVSYQQWKMHVSSIDKNQPRQSHESGFLSNVRLIADMSYGEHIPLVVVLQPMLFTTSKPLTRGEDAILARYQSMDPGSNDFFIQEFNRYDSGLTEITKNHVLTYINGKTMFLSQSDQLFLDVLHLSDRGVLLMAKQIAPVVWDKVMEKTTH